MRAISTALVVLALAAGGCRTSSLPSDGDGGVGDMAGGGGAGGGSGGACTILCTMGFTCCGNNQCVNLRNDIHNCGKCGVTCTAPNDFCDGQACVPPPCSPPCTGGTLCCEVQGPGPSMGPGCVMPTDSGTCPLGCPLCL